ncbi:hypothetical protein ACHHYP_20490 [Achlya hypogyna]|uniref:Secreted protein n=1 Tax=Achlya hypogyna TaxID=1202772 RepID=A0A1V9YL22_ACHHY|nr:hypothetical protein ACHHYP_20490 [Achlya hypogyna]
MRIVAFAATAGIVAAACTPVTSYLSSLEIERGVSVMADVGCRTIPPASDCLDAQCRKCRIYNTTDTFEYVGCPASLLPPVVPAENISCSALLFPSEAAAGVSVLYDATCTTRGGVGCLPHFVPCRRCNQSPTPTRSYWPCGLATAKCQNESTLPDVIGISDATCLLVPTLPGCQDASSCRLCRLRKQVQNTHLPDCSVLYWISAPLEASTLRTNLFSVLESVADAKSATAGVAKFSANIGMDILVPDDMSWVGRVALVIAGALSVALLGLIVYAKYTRAQRLQTVALNAIIQTDSTTTV